MTNTATTVLLLVALVAAAGNWFAVARAYRRLEWATKPLVMAALVAAAVTMDPAHATRRVWFVAAGGFSLVGDVLLMLPRQRFLGGLAAFLVAHLCYIVGLGSATLRPGAGTLGVFVVAAGVVAVGRPILRALRRGPEANLFAPTATYLAVIATMVVMAFAAGPWLAAAGAVLFATSDALLAWTRWVSPLFRVDRVAVMTTYHLGQAGLIVSLAVTA